MNKPHGTPTKRTDQRHALLPYTGRIVKEGKRGAINQLTPPILKRLNLNTDEWLARSCAFEENYHRLFSKWRSARRKAA